MPNESPVTDRMRTAVANPITTDADFDPYAELDDILSGLGMSASDSGGRIEFRGADPVVPSVLRLGGAAAIALVAKSVAVAKLWRDRSGRGQDISMDLRVAPHRLSPFYDRKWELLGGYPAYPTSTPSVALSFMFHRTADDRFVMPLNSYPKLRVAAQTLLDVSDEPGAVAQAVATWKGRELEEAAASIGAVIPMVRSVEEFLDEPQCTDYLADAPLVEVTKIVDSEPVPLPSGVDTPLSGIRALGMGHVIAGPGAGRALALHGADVLNLWRPDQLEHDNLYISANVGLRSAWLDPRQPQGKDRLRELLVNADVFFANRRPGYLDRIGLSAEQAADIRPGIVHATVSLAGQSGPWAHWSGFDQAAGCLAGVMNLEGGGSLPGIPPIFVVNDYIVSWLLTLGIIEALRRRAREGGSYRVHVSLTRVAMWIIGLGVFDKRYAASISGSREENTYLDPETFTAMTPLGRYQGVTEQVTLSETPGDYRHVLLPRGSCEPEWSA
ncbi:CoA transferase [Kibdelosporangium aridum]|uniref:CoA transferase n=1 Tax=Kibdelosporangium aridum TaxID=2030 RepID=UPI0005262AEA